MGSLNQVQNSILIGSLLGDGNLRKAKGKLNALFEVNHTIRQKFYVDWKYANLKEFVLTPPKERKSNGGRIAYRFTTQSIPSLTSLYETFYLENKKIVPANLVLNPLSLSVWFMDDGSKSRNALYLNTQQFSISDQAKLLGILKCQFNLTGSLNRDKQYFRVRFNLESSRRLEKIIRPYILPGFFYKLGNDPVTTDPKGEIPVYPG